MKTMKARYEIRAAADDEDEAEVWIYGEIGPDWWGDGSRIDAKTFAKDFGEITASRISLRVNSPGGSVSHCMAIYNAIKRHPATVAAFIDGQALSAASVVVLAADEVVMAENAMYMIHQPCMGLLGWFNAEQLRKEADTTDKYAETIIVAYRHKTGLSDEKLNELMDEETWFTAEEALEAGFVDRVSDDGNASASFDPDLERFGYRHVPESLRREPAGTADDAAEAAADAGEDPPPAAAQEAAAASGDTDITLKQRAAELLTLREPRYGGHDG